MSLKIYTKILTYKENASKSIYLVKNEIDGLLYVHRILTEYNKDIYDITNNSSSKSTKNL